MNRSPFLALSLALVAPSVVAPTARAQFDPFDDRPTPAAPSGSPAPAATPSASPTAPVAPPPSAAPPAPAAPPPPAPPTEAAPRAASPFPVPPVAAPAPSPGFAPAPPIATPRRPRRALLGPTYLVSLALPFAHSMDLGADGLLVSGSVFGTIPRMRSGGPVRGGLSLGGSAALGYADGGFCGLFSFDLGASIRVGGRIGFFGAATWSPGVVSPTPQHRPAFTASGFRALAGVAVDRRVFFVGWRVLSPPNDLAFHALELGAGFRYGARPRPRSATPAPGGAPAASTPD